MRRAARSRLCPWIERLILSYGGPGGSSSSGRLKAHVIGVGQMSQSQAQGSEGPTGLLFLSDGVLQIPAILTASAWEHLQDHEDRECFTSLVNSTVCIQDYRLQFHMALEQTKCRFYLSVGELATTAAGPLKDNTPCSTTQASIRLKICKTWRALLGQETQDSQKSPCGFDLSELLGEWQHDCLQAVLEDVQERLGVSQQPSTSTLIHPDTSTATSWGGDRVRYKGVKCFKVPIKCLLIPEEDTLQLQMPPNVGSRTTIGRSAVSENRKRDSPQVCKPTETMQLSVDDREWRIAKPAFVDRDQEINENSPCPGEDSIMLHEDMIPPMIDSDTKTLYNPWDIFPPPFDTSSSSDASPEATPTQSLHNPTATEFKSAHSVIPTSTQLPVHSSKEDIRQTLESSKGQHSSLPPYQKLPHSASFPTTAASVTSPSASPTEPFLRPSTLWPSTGEPHTSTAQQRLPAGDQEGQILGKDTEVTVKGKYRKAKRKRSEPTEEEEEEEEISGSPPSWLFDTQAGSGAEEGSSHQQGQSVGAVFRRRATVHSDGMLFSYSYQVSGANLQDFSQFTVAESLLHWAVKYLVPKPTDTSGTSNQTKVTPLKGPCVDSPEIFNRGSVIPGGSSDLLVF